MRKFLPTESARLSSSPGRGSQTLHKKFSKPRRLEDYKRADCVGGFDGCALDCSYSGEQRMAAFSASCTFFARSTYCGSFRESVNSASPRGLERYEEVSPDGIGGWFCQRAGGKLSKGAWRSGKYRIRVRDKTLSFQFD